VSKGEPLGTSFTKNGWNGIASRFKELTGKNYANQSLGTCLITLEENHADDINYLVKKLVFEGIMPKILLMKVMNEGRKNNWYVLHKCVLL